LLTRRLDHRGHERHTRRVAARAWRAALNQQTARAYRPFPDLTHTGEWQQLWSELLGMVPLCKNAGDIHANVLHRFDKNNQEPE